MCDPCPPPLAEDPSSLKESFELINDCFKRANIAVTPTGVVREHATKAFTVVPDTIELGQIIGKGASSFVQVGVHTPSQTPLALKVLSVFDKSKRDQLMAEINTLYDADCDWYV